MGEHDPAVPLHVPHGGQVVGHPGPVLQRLELVQTLPGHHEASVDLLDRLVKQEREGHLQTNKVMVIMFSLTPRITKSA